MSLLSTTVCLIFEPPQLSITVSTPYFDAKDALSSATTSLQNTVTSSGQSKIGLNLSCTLTLTMHVLEFPLSSVALNSMMTGFAPSRQQKSTNGPQLLLEAVSHAAYLSILLTSKVTVPHSSLLPLSKYLAGIFAVPSFVSETTVFSMHAMTGGVLSSTTRITASVAVFPEPSVAVYISS